MFRWGWERRAPKNRQEAQLCLVREISQKKGKKNKRGGGEEREASEPHPLWPSTGGLGKGQKLFDANTTNMKTRTSQGEKEPIRIQGPTTCDEKKHV